MTRAQKPMKDKAEAEAPETPIPALFATIHFRSEHRPDGYTSEQIAALNRLANGIPDPEE